MRAGRGPGRSVCSECSGVAPRTPIGPMLGRTQDTDSAVAPYSNANHGFLYHVYHGSPLSRSREYIMSTHASPDDVYFTRGDLARILEGRPPVGSPRHLEDGGGPLHALHPKTRSKRSRFEVRNDVRDRSQKYCPLLGRKRVEVSSESGRQG